MKLTLVADDGELLDMWDLGEHDLSKPLARQALMIEIASEVAKAKQRAVESLTERDDIGKLPIPAAAKKYARRTFANSWKRQPEQFQKVNAEILNPGKKNHFQNYDAADTTAGKRATAPGFRRPGSARYKKLGESRRLLDDMVTM